jgi:hypothetical protein
MPAVAELRCGDERVSREFEARTQSPNLFHGEPSGLPPEIWKQQFLIRIRDQIALCQPLLLDQESHNGDGIGCGSRIVLLLVTSLK